MSKPDGRHPEKGQLRSFNVLVRASMERECRRLGLERDGLEPKFRGLNDQLGIIREYEQWLKDWPKQGLNAPDHPYRRATPEWFGEGEE